MAKVPQEQVFPTLPIYPTRSGQRRLDGGRIGKRLVANGAPKDFKFIPSVTPLRRGCRRKAIRSGNAR
jgi:hypothetical protein